MNSNWRLLVDLVMIAILILGVWQFRTPRGARAGNLTAAFALLCALGAVLYSAPVREPTMVVLALVVGGMVGWLVAIQVNMIQVPAMVAFQHGAGGVAALIASFVELTRDRGDVVMVGQLSGVLGVMIGAATFSGSMVASARLSDVVRQTPTILPKHNLVLAAILLTIVALGFPTAFAVGTAQLYGLLALIVLLAEAEVDPDMLFDLAEINSAFPTTDLAIVVGACDVVNPAANNVEGSPISGMPILAVHESQHVLVCNLDGRPGYSGVENSLYRS